MAELSFDFDEEFYKKLEKLENSETITEKMVNEARPIVVAEMKNELGKYKRTSELVNSVKPSKTKRKVNGTTQTVIRPTGKSTSVIANNGKRYTRTESVRNMEKLASLEFGNSRGEKPTPVIEKVVEGTKEKVFNKMVEVFERETKL